MQNPCQPYSPCKSPTSSLSNLYLRIVPIQKHTPHHCYIPEHPHSHLFTIHSYLFTKQGGAGKRKTSSTVSISRGERGHRNPHPLSPGLMAAHRGKPFAGTNSKTIMRPRHQNGISLSLSSSAVTSSGTATSGTGTVSSSRSRRSAVRSEK